jgi:hypothetical protein
MPEEDQSRRHSAISQQAFELLKVVFTLVLTGVIGGGITYYYQNRSHREQQEAQELESARQSALTFLREVGDILEQRKHHAFRVVSSVEDNAPPEERDQIWKDYTNALNAWNTKWNLYRALVLEQFGPEMQKRFYDEEADSKGVWEKSSITGKLIFFDRILTDFHRQNPDKPPLGPKEIRRLDSSIAQDCYAFYSEVIARIQEGRVGRHSWVKANGQKPNG